MKLALVSSFPEMVCGIAQYTYSLVKWLSKDVCVDVFTHYESKPKKLKNVYVKRAFDRNNFWSYLRLVNELKSYDLIHIQHEFGLYGKFGGPFNGLFGIYLLRKIDRAVVTLHTVFTPEYTKGYRNFLKSYRPLLSKTPLWQVLKAMIFLREYMSFPKRHAYIVHSYEQKNVLEKRGMRNIYVVRHGVPVINIKKRKRKERLTLLCFGFVDYRKNYELVIKALRLVDVNLIIAGKANPSYLTLLKKLAEKFKVKNRVEFIDKFLSEKEKMEVFAKADVLVYPVISMSQSGVVSDAISFRMPVIVGAFPYMRELFQDFGDLGYLIKRNDEREIARGISHIINNWKVISRNLEKAYKDMNWKKTAEKHIKIYEEVLTL